MVWAVQGPARPKLQVPERGVETPDSVVGPLNSAQLFFVTPLPGRPKLTLGSVPMPPCRRPVATLSLRFGSSHSGVSLFSLFRFLIICVWFLIFGFCSFSIFFRYPLARTAKTDPWELS